METKNFLNHIVVFLYFALITIAALVIIAESGLCVLHLIQNSAPRVVEILCLIIVSFIGGVIGLLFYICDVEDL